MDLADVAGNVQDGCHIASMGGFWMTLIYGFAGMRDTDGRLSFAPKVPEKLGGLRFPLEIRGQRLEVDSDPDVRDLRGAGGGLAAHRARGRAGRAGAGRSGHPRGPPTPAG